MSAGGWGLLAFSLSAMGIIALAYVRLCSYRAPVIAVGHCAQQLADGGSAVAIATAAGLYVPHAWVGAEYPCTELWPVPEASACDGVVLSTTCPGDDPYYVSRRQLEASPWWEKDVDPRYMVPAEAIVSAVKMTHTRHWALIHVAPAEVDAYSALGWTVVQ